jgi:VWFA-related protein
MAQGSGPAPGLRLSMKSPHLARVLGIPAVVALGSVGALPALQVQAPVFRSGVALVQVDVMVVDKTGKPVHGLTKDDFELFDKGKRQEISVLAESHVERPQAARRLFAPDGVASNRDVDRDRIVVLVVDDLAITWDNTERAKALARRVVTELHGRAQIALVFTRGGAGVEFTRDATTLLEAIDRMRGHEDPFENRGDITSPVPTYGEPAASPMGGTKPPNFKPQADGDLFLTTLRDAVERLPRGDGRRKALILVSEGRVSLAPGDDFKPAVMATDTAEASVADWSRTGLYSSTETRPRVLESYVNAVRKAGVSVYALDAGGPIRPGQAGFMANGVFLDDVAMLRQNSLSLYAEETGGIAVVNTNDATGAADRVVEDLNSYYTIGFAPPNPKDTRMHTLDVRITRPGLIVRHRRTYQLDATPPKGTLALKDPLGRLANLPVPSGDLAIRAWATVLPPPAPGLNAPVVAWIDTGSVPIGEYAIYVVDLTRKKELAAPVGRTLRGAPPTLLPLSCPPLPPGRYQIRISARDRELALGGSVYLNLEVPDFAGMDLAIAGFVVGRGEVGRTDAAPLSFAPTLDRTFSRADELRIAFEVWRKAPADVRAAIEVIDADDRVVHRSERTDAAGERPHVEVRVPLASLPAGAYALRATITTGRTARTQLIGFSIE